MEVKITPYEISAKRMLQIGDVGFIAHKVLGDYVIHIESEALDEILEALLHVKQFIESGGFKGKDKQR